VAQGLGPEYKPQYLKKKKNQQLKKKTKKHLQGWEWWFTPIIPATWEAEVGRWWLKTSLGKVSVRPYLKSKLTATGPGVWLKWYKTLKEKKKRKKNHLL
jgi:hypothetical protein